MRKLDDWETLALALSGVAVLGLIVGCAVGYFIYPVVNKDMIKNEESSMVDDAHHIVDVCKDTMYDLTSNTVIVNSGAVKDKAVEMDKKEVEPREDMDRHIKNLIKDKIKDKLKDKIHNRFEIYLRNHVTTLL